MVYAAKRNIPLPPLALRANACLRHCSALLVNAALRQRCAFTYADGKNCSDSNFLKNTGCSLNAIPWPRYIHTVAPATSFNAIDERTRLNFANPTILSLNAPYSTSAESPSAARQKFKHSGVFDAGFGSLKLVVHLAKHGDAAQCCVKTAHSGFPKAHHDGFL